MRDTPLTTRRTRPLLVLLALLSLVAVVPATSAAATTPPDETLLTLPPTDQPTTTDNEFLDLERELTDCVGSALPKPGCGREPTHSGDRGSPMQWAVFAVMGLGIAFIGWRIVAGARKKPTPSA